MTDVVWRSGLLAVVAAGSLATSLRCFEEFPWRPDAPDVRAERLCAESADPDGALDTTFIDCALEGASFFSAAAPGDSMLVMAYNIERGFQADAQLEAILLDPGVPIPDVILLSEADRGCQRTGFRNVAREYAEALGYGYVFATEFVELPGDRGETGPYDPPLCEHGNAIVSRWPLGNVREIRHAAQWSWYTPPGFPDPDEPRLGGRVALAADARVGERLVRLYVLHLESTNAALDVRDAQLREIAHDAEGTFHPVVVGGDLNLFEVVFHLEQGTEDANLAMMASRGFADAHGGLPFEERITSDYGGLPLVIDFVLVRGARTRDAAVCPGAICDGLSDHRPVWARIDLVCAPPDRDCDGVPDAEDECPGWWDPEQLDVCHSRWIEAAP